MKKKVSLFVMLLLIGLSALTAQNTPVSDNSGVKEHLEFKGIEITGTLDNMVEQLKKMGYTSFKKTETGAYLKGKFANESCELFIYETPKSHIVYTVAVAFDKQDSWYSLKSDYKKFKEQLREKYDVRPNVTERFISPYYEGDGYELQALRLNKCIYGSRFKLDNGEIILYIMENQIVLKYDDKEGYEIYEREQNQSALDDL